LAGERKKRPSPLSKEPRSKREKTKTEEEQREYCTAPASHVKKGKFCVGEEEVYRTGQYNRVVR